MTIRRLINITTFAAILIACVAAVPAFAGSFDVSSSTSTVSNPPPPPPAPEPRRPPTAVAAVRG